MIIYVKNKDTLLIDDFKLRCCIGKNGLKSNKKEGDLSTPKGIFKLERLYYRKDRIALPKCKIKKKIITKNLGWCDNPNDKKYNKEINIFNKKNHENFYRDDHIYDCLITINHNPKKIRGKGSAIFIHLTHNYNPTAGCIALKKKDFFILLKLIDQKTKIKIG